MKIFTKEWLSTIAAPVIVAGAVYRVLMFVFDVLGLLLSLALSSLIAGFDFIAYNIKSAQIVETLAILIALSLVRPLSRRFDKKPLHPVFVIVCLLLVFFPLRIVTRTEAYHALQNRMITAHFESYPDYHISCYVGTDATPENLVLEGKHILWAEAVPVFDDVYAVSFDLNDEGRRMVKEATKQNVGEQISFFTNGVFAVSHPILQAIDGRSIFFNNNFTADEANFIANSFNATRHRHNYFRNEDDVAE